MRVAGHQDRPLAAGLWSLGESVIGFESALDPRHLGTATLVEGDSEHVEANPELIWLEAARQEPGLGRPHDATLFVAIDGLEGEAFAGAAGLDLGEDPHAPGGWPEPRDPMPKDEVELAP